MSNYRNYDLQELADMFQALSNPNRLKIFLRLVMCCQNGTHWEEGRSGCSCVGQVGEDLQIAPSTVSHHIKELRQAGLIRTERAGQQVRCWIDPETLRNLADFFTYHEC